jgi:hypothetical protein
MLSALLIGLGIILLAFMISSLPLYFAVKALGGKTSLLKTMLVTFLSGIIFTAIKSQFRLGLIIAFFVLIWIYHEVFRLKWFKAFIAWVLQFVFIAIFYVIATVILAALVGITLLGFI